MDRISSTENKRPLDVYYYIDLKSDQDISFIERSLRINLNVNNEEYEIDKFVNCFDILNKTKGNNTDIIKRGLIMFNNMVEKLKLKSKNDTWLFYISNGNINNLYENVFVVLLNKEPMFKKSHYVISKQSISIDKELTKDKKIERLKLFNKNIQELLRSDKVITYTNLD
jgi:hypothetical protein